MRRRWTRRRTWAAALLLCLLAGLAASWGVGSLIVRGAASHVPAAAAPAEDFFLTASDGVRIAATYRPCAREGAPAVLLLHGLNASRAATARNAAWLAARGYATLTIDFRGHGRSDIRPRSFGLEEAKDARAAFDWLKRRQRGAPVAVIGISLGGAAALIAEEGPLPADTMVLHAVYRDVRAAIRNRIAGVAGRWPAAALEPLLSVQSWPRFGVAPARLSPLAAIRRYPGPVLVVGGEADRWTPPREVRALHAAAPGRKALWLAPGADHKAASDLASEDYRRRLAAFLAATIGAP